MNVARPPTSSDEEGFEELREAEMALSAIPKDHPDRPGRLNHIAFLLAQRHKRTGSFNDLEAAISKAEEVVAATPPTTPTE